MCAYCFFYLYGAHRALHVLTHSFPTRRSSDLELDVADICGKRDEIAGVDLRCPTKQDPVPVDDVERSVSLDGAEDFGGISVDIGNAVQGHPVRIALLVEH